MPARNALKRPAPVRVSVPFGEETVTLVFDRNAMTENWVRRLQEAEADVSANSRGLAEVLLEWDIYEDEAQTIPTPLTAEVLADMPGPFLNAISEAMVEAATPSSEEGNASSAISSTPSTDSTLPQASLQNGPEPSLSPVPLESPSVR